jgi:hypothetical protein
MMLAIKGRSQKKKVQSTLTIHKNKTKKEEIRKRIMAMDLRPSHDEGTTTHFQAKAEKAKEKRKKMAAANSVGAETKIAESTRMKKKIISPERTKTAKEAKRKTREKRIRIVKHKMATGKTRDITTQVAGKIWEISSMMMSTFLGHKEEVEEAEEDEDEVDHDQWE